MFFFFPQKLEEISKHLSRLDAIEAKDVIRLTCVGKKYVNDRNECVSCSGPGKYYFNGVLCVPCSSDSARFLNSKNECVKAKECNSGQMVAQPSTATSDTVCKTVKTCSNAEYEFKKPTATTDRECKPITAACATYEVEVSKPTKTSDRVCQSNARSCSEIWKQNPSSRSKNGFYNLVKYYTMPANAQSEERGRYARFSHINCRDSGRYSWNNGGVGAHVDYKAPRILEEVVWYSVFKHGRRACKSVFSMCQFFGSV